MIINKLSTTILLTASTLVLVGCGTAEVGQYDKFAQCLTDKGTTVYTTYWCPHCKDQKDLFGSSLDYLNVVECDPKGQGAQVALCEEKGVSSIPDWEFPDGTRKTGVQTLEQLSEVTGCELPQPEEQPEKQ